MTLCGLIMLMCHEESTHSFSSSTDNYLTVEIMGVKIFWSADRPTCL